MPGAIRRRARIRLSWHPVEGPTTTNGPAVGDTGLMCGRYALTQSDSELSGHYGAIVAEPVNLNEARFGAYY